MLSVVIPAICDTFLFYSTSSIRAFKLSQNTHSRVNFGYNRNSKNKTVAKSIFRVSIDDYQITVFQIFMSNFVSKSYSFQYTKNSDMKTIFRTVFYSLIFNCYSIIKTYRVRVVVRLISSISSSL